MELCTTNGKLAADYTDYAVLIRAIRAIRGYLFPRVIPSTSARSAGVSFQEAAVLFAWTCCAVFAPAITLQRLSARAVISRRISF